MKSPLDVRLADFVSLSVLVAVVLWGVSFVATDLALDAFHPLGLVAARLASGALLIGLWVKLQGLPLAPRPGDRALSMLLGALLAAHMMIQAYAMLFTTAVKSGWIVAFTPVVLAVAGFLFGRERLRALGWLGIVVATSGVLALTLSGVADLARASTGDWMQVSSTLTWAAFSLASAGPVARNGALVVMFFAMSTAAVVSSAAALGLGYVAPREGVAPWLAGVLVGPLDLCTWVSMLFLGLLCSGVAFVVWVRALDREGVSKSAAMLYFQPLFTLAASALVLDDPLDPSTWYGGPIVLLGVWLMRRGSPPRSAVKPVHDS